MATQGDVKPVELLWGSCKAFIVDADASSDRITFYIRTDPDLNAGYRIWFTPSAGLIQKRTSESDSWATIKTIW